jgi:hypothetical protein
MSVEEQEEYSRVSEGRVIMGTSILVAVALFNWARGVLLNNLIGILFPLVK